MPNAASAAKIKAAFGAAPPLPTRAPPASASYPGLARWMHRHAARLGLSSVAIAGAIGRAPSCVIGLLAGRNMPQAPTRRKLAELFGEPMPAEAFLLAEDIREEAVPARGPRPKPEPIAPEAPAPAPQGPMTLTYAGVPVSFWLDRASGEVVVMVSDSVSLRVPAKAA